MAVPLAFRIFYTTLYTVLNIVLVVLLLITPGDSIRQALSNHQLYNVFVIAGCYVLTLFLAIIILSSRFFTNRSVLSAIPKTWIPIEKGDVKSSVRKMIVESLSRSAAIAWDARPHIEGPNLRPTTTAATAISRTTSSAPKPDPQPETQSPQKKRRFLRKSRTISPSRDPVRSPDAPPVWGDIHHNGWSSPFSPDLPNLHYAAVIAELPNLVEAKAVSLAPPDPDSTPNDDAGAGARPGTAPQAPVPDMRVVLLLQRGPGVGLRDYMAHLARLSVLPDHAIASTFLTRYEDARFTGRPLSEGEFRELMASFAAVLRAMVLPEDILGAYEYGDNGEDNDEQSTYESILTDTGSVRHMPVPETDIDDDASSKSTPVTLSSRSLASAKSLRSMKSMKSLRSEIGSRNGSVRSWVGSEGTVPSPSTRSRSRSALKLDVGREVGRWRSERPALERRAESNGLVVAKRRERERDRPVLETRAGTWAGLGWSGYGGGGGGGWSPGGWSGGYNGNGNGVGGARSGSYGSLGAFPGGPRRSSTASGSVIRLAIEGEGEEYVITP